MQTPRTAEQPWTLRKGDTLVIRAEATVRVIVSGKAEVGKLPRKKRPELTEGTEIRHNRP